MSTTSQHWQTEEQQGLEKGEQVKTSHKRSNHELSM